MRVRVCILTSLAFHLGSSEYDGNSSLIPAIVAPALPSLPNIICPSLCPYSLVVDYFYESSTTNIPKNL